MKEAAEAVFLKKRKWMIPVMGICAAVLRPAAVPATPQKFQWNWRDSQELSADQSLRNAKTSQREKRAIAKAIASQLRPIMSQLEINSEAQLQNAALDTRVRMTDLNNDGIPEVVAQGMAGCSPTGNCPFWIFQKSARGYRLLLNGEAQTFTIQPTVTDDGFRSIVLAMRGSATEVGLTEYWYLDGVYKDVGCYDASWIVLEGDERRELKEPRITPCKEIANQTRPTMWFKKADIAPIANGVVASATYGRREPFEAQNKGALQVVARLRQRPNHCRLNCCASIQSTRKPNRCGMRRTFSPAEV